MRHLKTVRHAFLVVLMLTFSMGCSSDDNGDGDSGGGNSELTGNWYLKTYNGHEANDCEKQSNIEITSDGEYNYQDYNFIETDGEEECVLIMSFNGNYTVSGSTLTITTPLVPGVSSTNTYSISDGIMTLEGDDPFTGEYGITTWGRNP